MKIAFFGVPELGIIGLNTLISNNKNIAAIIPPEITNPGFGMMAAIGYEHNIPVLTYQKSLKELQFIEAFKNINPDVAVVCSFNCLIPKEILQIPRLGFINVHHALLPEYRGGNPIFHVIVNNEAKTGITIHYMDESFDTGDIIYQKEIKIEADETCGTLFSRLNFISSQILIETIEKLEKNETLPRTPQIKEGNYKKAPNVYQDLGDTVIDWNKDAAYIERFVRALNPYFGALTNFRGYAVKIWAGKYILDKPRKEPVGSVYKVSKDALAIVTGKGLFLPTCMQLGNFVITDIQDFIKRVNPKTGEIFAGREMLNQKLF